MTDRSSQGCPLCLCKNKATIIRNIDIKYFDDHPFNTNYELVQCSACGFVYANTKYNQAQLDEYYTNLSKYENKNIGTGGGYSEYDKIRLKETANFLLDIIENKNCSILDIGCANGGLLKELKELGFTNVFGADPSAACVANTIANANCICYLSSLFSLEDTIKQKFDVIILSHVWEHILNLHSATQIVFNLLNENGIVYVECPNASHYKNYVHAPFQEFNTEHINHFTSISLRQLFSRFNFQEKLTDSKLMKLPSNEDYDAVYSVFIKQNHHINNTEKDDEILNDINSYINKSEKIWSKMEELISRLVSDNKPLAFYGIGQLCFKLLALPCLKNYKQLSLFDGNSLIVGKSIGNISIQNKSSILELTENTNIVITSLVYENPIKKDITKIFAEAEKPVPNLISLNSCYE